MLRQIIETCRAGGRSLWRKIGFFYSHAVTTYVRPYTPTREVTVRLNGVEVPIDRSPLDTNVPGYEPALPTKQNPQYEDAEVHGLRAYCRDSDRVVVIGGGLGVTAIVAARCVGSNGCVRAYEPSEVAVRVARRAIEWNECEDRVQIVNAAVEGLQHSCFTYRMPVGVTTVRACDLPDADVYEIDCEGAETDILEKMTVLPRVILVETHGNHEAVVQILEARGYVIDSIVDDREQEGTDRTHVRALRVE